MRSVASTLVILGLLDVPTIKWGDASKPATLRVFAADSATGKPVSGVDVTVRAPGWYWSETHQEPEWFADTDSTGWARLRKIPAGIYDVGLCQNTYDRRTVRVDIGQNKVDTLRVKLLYLGPPRDGRRCEIRYQFHPPKGRGRKP